MRRRNGTDLRMARGMCSRGRKDGPVEGSGEHDDSTGMRTVRV